MTFTQTNKLNNFVQKICSGNFTESDVGMLFIWLRPLVSNDAVLLDLCNFVAHYGERDRGVSYEHIHDYVNNFIRVSEEGGTIFGHDLVFISEKVIEDLAKVLDNQGIVFNKVEFKDQKVKIIDALLGLMEETDFKFDDPRVVRCHLKRNGQKMGFCLNLNLKGPRIITSPGASILVNLFD